MPAVDVNSLFSRAEQAFLAGRLDDARRNIVEVQRIAGDHPAVLHLLALVEKKRGDLKASRAAFERALVLSPEDPQIANNFANLLKDIGQEEEALHWYGAALATAPGFADALYNRALLLQRLGRFEDALSELDKVSGSGPPSAKVHSARGSVLRELGRLDDAAAAYDAALALDPRRLTALHGRARTALERGEADSPERYKAALELSPGDRTLLLGLAEALEAAGDAKAIEVLESAVENEPQWAEGQASLARMRWEAGEGSAFSRDLQRAIQAFPANAELWLACISSLAAAELTQQAADAASDARKALGEDPQLRLLEAVHASEAGELDRADRLFGSLPPDLPERATREIQHRVRQKQYARALGLADAILAQDRWNVFGWAMTGLLWRAVGDERAEWLHAQPGLAASMELELPPAEIQQIAERLRGLHRTRAHPIGQSLRGGTQTRGRLFDRKEAEILLLRDAIRLAVERYWDSLPPPDPDHPLLRLRDRSPRLEGSWSVRLTGGGFHVAHIHPEGILSSACYVAVPAASSPREAWLELGRPPKDLGLELEPLVQVEPRPGRMALFPSTLYHGTRPFSEGERLTVAFDITAS
jgi:tetratricopeptide (TPR) repeat protein